jgi:thiol reductant ABC exporter CydC subunit
MTTSAAFRVLNQGLGVAIPTLAAGILVGLGSSSSIAGFAFLLAGMAVVKGTFRYLEQFTGHAVAFRLLAGLRAETYRRIVPLAPAGLEDDRTGDLVNRVIGDIDRVEPFYAHTIAPLASAIVVPVLAAIGIAVWIEPFLALTFLPFPLLMAGVPPWIRARRVAQLSKDARHQSGETAALFTDAIQGAREIAIFDARDVVSNRIETRSQTGTSTLRALSHMSAFRVGLGDLLAGGAVVTMLVVAAARFGAGLIGIPEFAAAIVISWVGTAPARAVEEIVPDVEQALAAAERLYELADRRPPVPTSPGTEIPADGAVVYQGVSVTFPGSDAPALSGIDVAIRDKSFVAIVGPSGSGKSTLVELLVRFRDPDAGRVILGGADMTRLEQSLLRETVTLVPQRSDIFHGTLADNLLLARPAATREEMQSALNRAQLSSWLNSLDNGLDTAVGELGSTLSGGQRQRLAIARAFLRDPRVLVLDEATSELDGPTERLVLDEIAREHGKRTVIVVAHRLASIIAAEAILVVDAGRIVERGTHESLLAGGGVYSGLWQRHLDLVPGP